MGGKNKRRGGDVVRGQSSGRTVAGRDERALRRLFAFCRSRENKFPAQAEGPDGKGIFTPGGIKLFLHAAGGVHFFSKRLVFRALRQKN